ncbi:MAG: peptidoglycan binding domain-containing protein [bacterium]
MTQPQSHSHPMALPKSLSVSGQRPSSGARLIFIILAPVLFILLANGLIAARMEGVIYPGVSVAGIDVSGLTPQQATSKIQAVPLGRSYVMKVGNKTFTATNEQLGAHYDLKRTIDLAYLVGRQNGLPLFGIFESKDRGQLSFSYSIDYRKLQKFTSDVVRDVGKPPRNAEVIIDNGVINAVQDESGLRVDRAEVTRLLSESLADAKDATFVMDPKVVPADIRLPATEPAKTQVTSYMNRSYSLTYNDRKFVPSTVDVGHWLSVMPDRPINPSGLVVNIDEQEVRGYIQSIANQVNVNPINKKVVLTNGKTNVEREGSDGLALNQEAAANQLIAALKANESAAISLTASPIAFKTETTRTISLDAPKYIEVNLSQQKLWAYENAQLVYTSPITSGAAGAGLGTATGLFAIYYKTTNTYLNGRTYGYNYNVHVNYWMPFYLGYGLHDASWRSSFGGQDYYYGGSHGCVNLPDATAAFIYDWSEIGTPVWVHT